MHPTRSIVLFNLKHESRKAVVGRNLGCYIESSLVSKTFFMSNNLRYGSQVSLPSIVIPIK